MAGSILIVDDDADLRQWIKLALQRAGCQSREASTTRQALACLNGERRVDLVLLDCVLPDGNGLDLIAGIRGRPPAAPDRVVITAGLDRRAIVGGAADGENPCE